MFKDLNFKRVFTFVALTALLTVVSYLFVAVRSEGGFESGVLSFIAIICVGIFYIVAFPAFYIVSALNFISFASCTIALIIDCIIWGFLLERLSPKWKTARK